MAVTVGKIDEIIREYLLYRGLISTSKQLESELKNEKEKKFRVDKIMDILHTHINNHDLAGLREYWEFLDQRLFSRLEQTYTPSIRKLETSLLKLYIVNAIQSNKPEKVMEFFEKMTPELQGQAEWRDWFVLPFTKNPEETRIFAMYFTRQWQDTLFLTLHNFLSVIVRSMIMPSAFEYEEEARKIAKLQEENNKYKNMLRELQENKASLPEDSLLVTTPVGPPPGPSSFELMDDFSVISQDSLTSHKPQTNQPRTQQLRSFIRNISSSPIMGRKTSSSSANKQSATNSTQASSNQKAGSGSSGASRNTSGNSSAKSSGQSGSTTPQSGGRKEETKSKVKVVDGHSKVKAKQGFTVSSPRPVNAGQSGLKHSTQHSDIRTTQTVVPSGGDVERPDLREESSLADDEKPFILVNQDDYLEHKACITHCRFNNSGKKMASADVDGVVKIWSLQPAPVTEATNLCRSSVLSLDWTQSDRLLLGTKTGSVSVFDGKEKKIVKEVMMDSAYPRVVSLSCNPSGTSFVCSAVGRLRHSGTADMANTRVGRLAIWDLKTMKIERSLSSSTNLAPVNWSCYNHNGQLLVTAVIDGSVRLFDTRTGDCISSWMAHQGEVHSVLFSTDQTSCYSIGADNKFIQWSIHNMGQQLCCSVLHQGAVGPFVFTGHGGYRQVQTPKGKLFALEPEGQHIVTCAPTGAQIYKMTKDASFLRSLYLGGHRSPVVTVDWSPAAECRLCLSGSMDGRVRVSSIIPP